MTGFSHQKIKRFLRDSPHLKYLLDLPSNSVVQDDNCENRDLMKEAAGYQRFIEDKYQTRFKNSF